MKLISRLSHLMEKQMSLDFDETENVSFFPTERGKLRTTANTPINVEVRIYFIPTVGRLRTD